MSTFTLDDIKAAAERRYDDTRITLPDRTVVLRNTYDLTPDQEAQLEAINTERKTLGESELGENESPGTLAATLSIVVRSLEVYASSPLDDLVAAVDGKLSVLLSLLNGHVERTQSGEGARSAS